jgi:hypothetical protein
LKKSVKIAIISAIAAVIVISALAVTVHLRLSAIEGNETREESTSEKINEAVNVITNQTSEENESAEQLEKEGK